MKAIKWFTIFFAVFILQKSSLHAQGTLTPPGAPAPTMKTLDQIQPRTPISALPFMITNSGSYYLTANLSVSGGDGIDISATNVTVDLNGFTISSTAPAANGRGIALLGNYARNITILNGFIRGYATNDGAGNYGGSGFASGIMNAGFAAANIRIDGITVSGCIANGISPNSSSSSLVENCTVQTVGASGITASIIKNSSAYDCGFIPLSGITVIDCTGESKSSYGGSAIQGTTVENCYAIFDGTGNGAGIIASLVKNSHGASYGSGPGISADNVENSSGTAILNTAIYVNNSAVDCSGTSGGGPGFSVSSGGVLTRCTSGFSATGINAGDHCIIRDCVIANCLTNGIVAGQSCHISGCTVTGTGTGAAGVGISADIRCTIEDCTVNDSQNDGILASGDSTVQNNHASHNGLGGSGSGIHTTGAGSRIEGNHTRDNANYGIRSDGGAGADIIIRNSAGGNGTAPYLPASGATFGPIQTPAAATSPTANFSF